MIQKTVGTVLKAARRRKRKSLRQLARQTKIKERFLQALEEDQWSALPDFPVTQGFARSYSEAIGADVNIVAALLRRDFPQKQEHPRSQEIPLTPRGLWTPKTTVFAIVVATIIVLGVYLVRQYMLFVGSPPLDVDVTQGEIVKVIGKTSPSATIEVNGKAVLVEEDGTFEVALGQEDLSSPIEVKAISRSGKETIIQKELF